MTTMAPVVSWERVQRLCEVDGPVSVPVAQIPHPAGCGFRRGQGLPMGQAADWRLRLTGDRCFHVREYEDRYTAHVDRLDPQADPLGHLAVDCAPLWIAGWAIAGGAVTRSMAGAASFALVGGVLAALREGVRTVSHRNDPISEGGRA